MKKFFIITLIINIFFTSCVPYKKIVYMQGDLKEYQHKDSLYKVKKKDILFIDIRSSNTIINQLFKSGDNTNRTLSTPSDLYINGYTVDQNGFIELPLIKKVFVEGKTFEEIKQEIQNKLLEKHFKSLENIFIKIKLSGIPYTILGEVNHPKTGVLFKERATILDVIGDAQDLNLTANRNQVVIMRYENGKLIKKELDLTDAETINSPYFYVRPNDIIYIPPLKQKTWGTGTTLQQTISTTITALSLITTIILLSNYIK